MAKKLLRVLGKCLLGLVGFIIFYFLLAYILSSLSVNKVQTGIDEIDIYILTNGVHSDIVVPTVTDQVDWNLKVNHLVDSIKANDYKYLALGWGDKGFYLNTPSWAELKASTALKAMVGWSGTAMHATYYERMVESESCTKISISKSEYSRLIKFINSSFEQNEDQSYKKIKTDVRHGNTDAFYEATGRYHIFNTCNSWTNRGLKNCGQKACLWTALQKPIFNKYK